MNDGIDDKLLQLKELIEIINKSKVDGIKKLGFPFRDDALLSEFYEAVVARYNGSSKQSAELEQQYEQNPSYFRKQKSDLIRRLIDSLFLIDLKESHYNLYQAAYYKCHQEWAAIKILLGKQARQTAIYLCEKLLDEAAQYEFVDICASISQVLRYHYASREKNTGQFEHYNALFKKYKLQQDAEQKVEEAYLTLKLLDTTNVEKEEVKAKAEELYAGVQDTLAKYDTHNLHLCGYLLKSAIYTSVNDYVETIKVCEEAIDFFEKKPFKSHIPLQIFYYQQLVCHTQLKQFEEGKAIAKKCLDVLEKGSFNWFKYYETYFILCLYSKKYAEAQRIFLKATAHSHFKAMPDHISEMWKIYEAYLHYLIKVDKLELQDEDGKKLNTFRLGKFMNETPIFSQQKRGGNIAILSIQICYYLADQNYDKVAERIESLRMYRFRYLNQDENFRSNCFLKMLVIIPKGNYYKQRVQYRVKRYLRELKKNPLERANQAHQIEIIPYEDLWEMILGTLQGR